MKINHNSSNETKVPVNTINTMMEQISDLQEDVSEIQNEIDGLGQSISTVSVDADNAQIDRLNTTNLSSTEATVNTLTASVVVNTAEMSASTSHLGNADAGKVDTEILEADTASIDVGTVTALESVDADITRANIDSLSASNAEVNTLETNGITNTGDYTGKDISAENVTASNTVNTKDLNVTDTVNIKDLNISGHVSGVADITLSELETNELKATDSEIKTIKNEGIYTDNSNPLTPTPSLSSDSDRYTIELPTFDGTLVLTWKDGNTVRWTATVIGNGVDYGITFGCTEDQTYITELFQWNKKLYIRHRANGQLVYSYNAEKKIEINTTDIYYNMVGWANPKSLEELTEEDNYYQVVRASGTVWFGKTVIPRLDNGDENKGTFNYKGSRKLSELPTLSETDVGDVWNITEETYTDNRFVEGAGKPINAGDDVVAVLQETEGTVLIKEEEAPFNTLSPEKMFVTSSGSKIVTFTNGDVYKEVDSSWQFIPTLSNLGYTYNYLFELSNGTLLASSRYTYYGYLMYSTDDGDTWQPTDLDFGDNGMTESIIQTSTGRVIISTHEGVFYSDNNGLNWNRLEDAPWYGVFVKLDNETLLAVGCEDSKVYSSSDDGETWTEISSGVDINSIGETIDGKVVAIEIGASQYRGLVSSDNGYTWSVISGLNGDEISGLVKSNNTLYAYGENIWKTTDGINWTEEEKPEEILRYWDLDFIDNTQYFVGYIGQNQSGLYHFGGSSKVLRWDKFSAGVNYENFVAENITATESLKSEGTLEVDGVSTFNNNITQTGNYTATGNLNRTGNETITGVVVIGDLD